MTAHPALVKVSRFHGSSVAGPPALIILDKNSTLCSLASTILLRLNADTKKQTDDDLLFSCLETSNTGKGKGKDSFLNSSLSLNDYEFDEEIQSIRVASCSAFEKTALLQDSRMLLMGATHSGPVTFSKNKKKPSQADAILIQNVLYLFKHGENHPFRVVFLDYHNFTIESSEGCDDIFKLEREKTKSYPEVQRPFWISVSGAQSISDWAILFRGQCRNTIHHVVFGTPLEILSRRYTNIVPPILEDSIYFLSNPTKQFLREEGIFRKSCNGTDLAHLMNLIDSGELKKFSDDTDPHVVVGLIKRWLGQLPTPLLSPYQDFLSANTIEPQEERNERIFELVSRLPPRACAVLAMLCEFLFKVSEYSEKNLMGVENLSLVVGPNLLRPRTDPTTTREFQERTFGITKIVSLLIVSHAKVNEFAKEARKLIVAKNRKVEAQRNDPLSSVAHALNALEGKTQQHDELSPRSKPLAENFFPARKSTADEPIPTTRKAIISDSAPDSLNTSLNISGDNTRKIQQREKLITRTQLLSSDTNSVKQRRRSVSLNSPLELQSPIKSPSSRRLVSQIVHQKIEDKSEKSSESLDNPSTSETQKESKLEEKKTQKDEPVTQRSPPSVPAMASPKRVPSLYFSSPILEDSNKPLPSPGRRPDKSKPRVEKVSVPTVPTTVAPTVASTVAPTVAPTVALIEPPASTFIAGKKDELSSSPPPIKPSPRIMRKKLALSTLDDLEAKLQSEESSESFREMSLMIKQLQVQLQAETEARVLLEKKLEQEVKSRKIFEDKVREILESLHRKIQAQGPGRWKKKNCQNIELDIMASFDFGTSDFSIRRVTVEDIPSLLVLYQAGASTPGGLARTVDEITPEFIYELVSKSITSGLMLVAKQNTTGDIIAAVAKWRTLEPRALRHTMSGGTTVVHPLMQRKGLGKLIWQTFLEIIKTDFKDIARIELMTRESNKGAVKLYTSVGFSVEARLPFRILSVSGTLETDLLLAWYNPNTNIV